MKHDKVFIHHIYDAILKIEEYSSTEKEDFFKSTLLQDATIRQLEIIGEATKKISTETKEKYSDIPWRRMAGLRDILIHNYMGVDLNAVWEITRQAIPSLKKSIKHILE